MPDDPTADADGPGDVGTGRVRQLLLAASALLATVGLVVLGTCIADAARQQDPDAIAFTTGEDLTVDLAPGETRIVYLDPVLTGPMSMEVRPDEVRCRAEQAGSPVPVPARRESRYVRTERPSSSVGEVTGAAGGPLVIRCTADADRSLPLLLAAPGPAANPAFDPGRGTVVALVLTALAAVIAIATVAGSRRTGGPDRGRGRPDRRPPTQHGAAGDRVEPTEAPAS